MKKSFVGLIGLLSLALPGAAQAGAVTSSLGLSMTILASCSIVSTQAISFGQVAAIGANIDQTSTLTVNCSSTTPYTVSLSAGNGTGATVATRKMMSGTNAVNYTLFRDAARTQIWGITTTGTTPDVFSGTGSGANQAITIFARVPAQTVPPPGNYSDSVTITVTF
jgi:spore coat protein U-like protein